MSAVLMPPLAAHRARSPAPQRQRQRQGGADTSQPARHKVVQHTQRYKHTHAHAHAQIGGPGGAQCAFKSLIGTLVRQQPEVLQ